MHTIRLRRPWNRRVGHEDRSVRVDVPDLEPVPDFQLEREGSGQETLSSPVLYERSFNCPTGLDQSSRVRLRIQSMRGKQVQIGLNGQSLVESEISSLTFPMELTITDHLQPSNRLELQLSGKGARLDGEVVLRIDEPVERK